LVFLSVFLLVLLLVFLTHEKTKKQQKARKTAVFLGFCCFLFFAFLWFSNNLTTKQAGLNIGFRLNMYVYE
jgi:hypothetical protein